MKALVFDGQAPSLREVPTPVAAPGEALLRIVLAGVCNTDLEIVRGYMGFTGTLGHEFLGEVVTHPDASMVGRRVTAEINLACGACERCASGHGRHCATRTVLGILGKDGCFAEHLAMPTDNLHPVPDGVSDEAAVFTEPLAAAFEILEQLRVPAGAKVLVLGDGKLGLLCTMVLASTGADVTLAGHHDAKLALVEGLGVETTRDHTLADRLFDVVVEATGSPCGLDAALRHLRPRGTLVLKSTFHGAIELDTAKLVIDELTVIGSRCGPFGPALDALSARKIDPTPLLTKTYALEDGVTALQAAGKRGVMKVLLRP